MERAAYLARNLRAMDEIGLFPLGLVLLPGEQVPLHIFEDRYRELIGECLDEGLEFWLVLLDDEGLREIGTRAAVTDVLERFDDGRLNVVVEGRERFRIVALTPGRTFQTAEVEPGGDDAEAAGPAPEDVARAVARFRALAEIAGVDVEDVEPDPQRPSFDLAARVELEAPLKQELLEQRSEPERLRTLARMLGRAARTLRIQRERAHIAAGNGHIPRA